MGDGRPLHRAVPAESEPWLAVHVLRVAGVRAVVALVDGDFDLGSFGMRLRSRQRVDKLPQLRVCPPSEQSCPHHVVEVKARVGQFEVLEQAVELPAVERAPGAVQVVSGLRLLPRVVVVLELELDGGSASDLRQQERLRAAHAHLVEDAELLPQLGCDLFSPGLRFAVCRLFNICGSKTSEPLPVYMKGSFLAHLGCARPSACWLGAPGCSRSCGWPEV